MRLAVYTDYAYRRDGDTVYGERAFVLFLASLADHVDELVILGREHPDPGRSHYPLPAGVRFVALPFHAAMSDPFAAARSLLGSITTLRRTLDGVDALWLLGPNPHSIAFALVARARRVRVALGARQDYPAYVRTRHPGKRWLHGVADVLEAAWRGLARRCPIVVVGPELAAHYARAPRVLEMAVSLVRADELVPAGRALARPWPGPDGTLGVLTVTRLEEEKNPLLLADILAGLRAADDRWRMTICGEGPLADALTARLESLGVAQHCDLRGYVAHGELMELYRDHQAFLHVSWTEGFPQVLWEAGAAGAPVVATAVGGVARAGEGAAVLVPPGDAAAAVSALERVRDDAELRARLIRAGLERAAAHTLEAESARVAAFVTGSGPSASTAA